MYIKIFSTCIEWPTQPIKLIKAVWSFKLSRVLSRIGLGIPFPIEKEKNSYSSDKMEKKKNVYWSWEIIFTHNIDEALYRHQSPFIWVTMVRLGKKINVLYPETHVKPPFFASFIKRFSFRRSHFSNHRRLPLFSLIEWAAIRYIHIPLSSRKKMRSLNFGKDILRAHSRQ